MFYFTKGVNNTKLDELFIHVAEKSGRGDSLFKVQGRVLNDQPATMIRSKRAW